MLNQGVAQQTVRAAQTAVDHAEEHGYESDLWPSLLRAARWFIDRGALKRAAVLTFPAWGLAGQSPARRPVRRTDDSDLIGGTQFLDAVMTTAFHLEWSSDGPADVLLDAVIERFELEDDAPLRHLIVSAMDAATRMEPRESTELASTL